MTLSERISQKISKELKLDSEKAEVINYGAFAFFQISFSILLVIIFGFLLGILYQSLIVSFTSSILRKSSGGIHASKPNVCLIIGTFVTIVIALLANILNKYYNGTAIIILGLVTFIWSYYVVYKKAPVDTKAKPIRTEKKRKRMKRNSIIILSFYLFASLALIVLYYHTFNKSYLEYSVCIFGAIAWQVFTLTIIGHKILQKIDTLLCKYF